MRTAILGDIHGDYDRTMELVGDIDPDVPLVLVGDYFDRWHQAMDVVHWAMRRPNTTALLGNHDVLILGVLAEAAVGIEANCHDTWLWNGGERSDLAKLQDDPTAVEWLRHRPAMALVGDTLVQHCDSPVYLNFGGTVEDVNHHVELRLLSGQPDVLLGLFGSLCRRRQFHTPRDVSDYVSLFGARRLVHGHTPHTQPQAMTLFRETLINVDGALSRGFGPASRGFVHWLDQPGTPAEEVLSA